MAEPIPSFPVAASGGALYALLTTVTTRPLQPPIDDVTDVGPESSAFVAFASALALSAGFVADHVDVFEEDVGRLVKGNAPFLFVPHHPGTDAYAVAGMKDRRLTFVDPTGTTARVSSRAAAEAFTEGWRAYVRRLGARIEHAGVRSDDRERLAAALGGEMSSEAPLGWGIVLRPHAAESVRRTLRSMRPGGVAAELLAQSTVQSALTMAAWAIIGALALAGHAERANIVGWALLSATATLVQLVSTRLVGRFTMRAATTLRERLLEGALERDPDDMSTFGMGGLMVISAQADDFPLAVVGLMFAFLGVLTSVVATVVVLSAAPLAMLSVVLFLAFVALVLAFVPRATALFVSQQEQRMRLTTDTVERMLGHRTRLVQQTASSWHEGEDRAVHTYAEKSAKTDWLTTRLRMVARLYYVAASLSLFFVLVQKPTYESLALALGGMTLGMGALGALVDLVLAVANLRALWHGIGPLVAEAKAVGSDEGAMPLTPHAARERPLVELRGASYRYPGRTKGVLEGVNVKIYPEDRVLVEGPSGGGKTTLASLLTGARRPDSGRLLVAGIDRHALRESDLRRVGASAPQFYQNHVFSDSLAFNLLLGRSWPPSSEDLREAESVARALGLGPLLDRMPAGLFQWVGEMGWQLSHGEKSRVFLARALLQRADLLVLDETFGALDPANLEQCMQVVQARAQTLVVITHR